MFSYTKTECLLVESMSVFMFCCIIPDWSPHVVQGSPLPKGNRKVRVDDSGPDSDSEELERGPSIHEAAKNGDLNRVKQHIEHHNNSKE